MTKRQLWILISLVVAVVAILALSASLSQVEFSPGEPFAFGSGIAMRPMPSGVSAEPSPGMRLFMRVLLLFVMALIPFSIFYLIISPQARKRFLQNLIVLGIFLALISLLRRQMRSGEEGDLFDALGKAPTGEIGAGRPPAEFSGAAPQWLVIVVSFLLAVVIVAIILGVIWAILRSRRRPEPDIALEELAQKAEEAAETIEAGGDLRDTVIRCYAEMIRVARESRGLLRDRAMTPHEFEERLERSGLPQEQVHDLTHLFEDVRYGAKELGPWEGQRAVACLTAIAEACRALAHGGAESRLIPAAEAV